jgi:hypothetical protein
MNTSKLTLMKFAISRDRKKKAAAGELAGSQGSQGSQGGPSGQGQGQGSHAQEGQKIKAGGSGKGKAKDTVVGGNERWTGENIHVDSLVHAIVKELKKARNGVIQRGDLKKKLVCQVKSILTSSITHHPLSPSISRGFRGSRYFTGDG